MPSDAPPADDLILNAPQPNVGLWPGRYINQRRPRVDYNALISDWGPLTEAHVAEAARYVDTNAVMGLRVADLKSIRNSHHRLAQMLAGGMSRHDASRICNITPERISQLQGDPAFAELMAHYRANVAEEFTDFVSAAAACSMDMLGRLQQILDEEPDRLTPDILLKGIALLADRSGNGPTNKNLNVNINADVATRLRAAQARLESAGD